MSSAPTEIKLLVDNRPGEGLAAEHGFAALIEQQGRRILFDTGQGSALKHNAEKMGIDLAAVDTVVLSHGHYDHTGGLVSVLSSGGTPRLYFHADLLRRHYVLDQNGAREIGIPEQALEALHASPRLHHVTHPLSLTESIGIGAPIERTTGFEDAGGSFFLDAQAITPDPIEGDLVLWIRTEGGLVVVVGCCHAGVANTLAQVRLWTGEERVRALVGGLHLLHADRRRLSLTVTALKRRVPERLVACHCTGENAIRTLQEAFPGRLETGHTGMILRF